MTPAPTSTVVCATRICHAQVATQDAYPARLVPGTTRKVGWYCPPCALRELTRRLGAEKAAERLRRYHGGVSTEQQTLFPPAQQLTLPLSP